MVTLKPEAARRLMLAKQGLLGPYRFEGKSGILEFIRQAGCVQYDPVDVCGKNAELVLQARVKGFDKQMLDELLYQERRLVDYWDKNMSILSMEDWPCFSRQRQHFRNNARSRGQIQAVEAGIKALISEKGHLSSKELDLTERVDWFWAPTALSRAALESLYYEGELVIHHRTNAQRSYALATQLLPESLHRAEDPNQSLEAYHDWHVLRRIGAVGLLWNRASDAWLGIRDFKAADRQAAFKRLEAAGKISPVQVEGLGAPLYMRSEDGNLLQEAVAQEKNPKRMEFIAPLDSLLWDRKLVSALFGFDYKWEIYTPQKDRKYGHYVLPVLFEDHFAGRIEVVKDKAEGVLLIRAFWPEAGYENKSARRRLDRSLDACLKRFAKFNGMSGYRWIDASVNQ